MRGRASRNNVREECVETHVVGFLDVNWGGRNQSEDQRFGSSGVEKVVEVLARCLWHATGIERPGHSNRG